MVARLGKYLLVAGLCLGMSACAMTGSAPLTATSAALAQPNGAASQSALVGMSMEIASAIPINPHIKDRSRAQEAVIEGCLELDLFELAASYTVEVKDWRRGLCDADLAIYLVEHGDEKGEATGYLAKAEAISNAVGLEEWRADAVRDRISQARAKRTPSPVNPGASGSSRADMRMVSATRASDSPIDEQVKTIGDISSNGSRELQMAALASSIDLYEASYTDIQARNKLETLVRDGWPKVTILQKINVLLPMCDVALRQHDQTHALELLNMADGLRLSAKWPVESGVPVTARMATYRFKCGDMVQARTNLREAMATYASEKELMLNIERVGALLPVAQAYMALSDRQNAASIYRLATEESIVNPNSRPRAMDMSMISLSMALHGFEPDAELWKRMREIQTGLSDPW